MAMSIVFLRSDEAGQEQRGHSSPEHLAVEDAEDQKTHNLSINPSSKQSINQPINNLETQVQNILVLRKLLVKTLSMI